MLNDVSEEMLIAEFHAVAAARPETAEAAGAKQIFCRSWTTARAALEALGEFAPGMVKMVLKVVLKAGDAAHKAFCAAA